MSDSEHTAALHLKVGGTACSFCARTIQRAYGRQEGVYEVQVSLVHEEGLIRYDPARVHPDELRDTLRSLGYAIRTSGIENRL